jgi:predicted ATPase
MGIKRLRIENFKSFRELDLELGPFNVLIGAHASGKSNFVEALKFLRDIAIHGLEDAISLQGGVPYLTNVQIGCDQPLAVTIATTFENRMTWEIKQGEADKEQVIGATANEIEYSFALKLNEDGSRRIVEDQAAVQYTFFLMERAPGGAKEHERLGTGTIRFSLVNSEPHLDVNLSENVPLDAVRVCRASSLF